MEKYIQPFIDTCIKVFTEFVAEKPIAELPHFTDKNETHDWDISGIIGLTGEARGAVVLSVKKSLALKLTDKLTGSSHTDIDDEVVDAMGEIINIIAGNAKKGMENMFKLTITLPTIIKGKNHSILWSSSHTRIICIPFRIFETDTLYLSVALET